MAKAKGIHVVGKGAHATITTTVKAVVAALRNMIAQKGKISIPVLSYVMVKDASIIGTDLDTTTIVPFEGKGKGSFLIPYKQTLDALAGEAGDLVLEFHDTIGEKSGGKEDGRRFVKLTVGAVEFEFATLSTANFPQVPKQADSTLVIDGPTLETMLARTDISISNEQSRYTLNATLLKASNGKVTMVATDGHRLSLVTGKGDGTMDDTLIAPAATRWLRKNCGGDVSIGVDENTHTIKTQNGTIIARKITGQFPKYEQVMPPNNKIVATFNSPEKFSDILKRVVKCSDERSGAVKLLAAESKTTLSASSTDRGSAKADIPCVTVGLPAHSAALQMWFNGEYILDFLKVIDEGQFTLALKDRESAGVFEVKDFKYIIMPMRI